MHEISLTPSVEDTANYFLPKSMDALGSSRSHSPEDEDEDEPAPPPPPPKKATKPKRAPSGSKASSAAPATREKTKTNPATGRKGKGKAAAKDNSSLPEPAPEDDSVQPQASETATMPSMAGTSSKLNIRTPLTHSVTNAFALPASHLPLRSYEELDANTSFPSEREIDAMTPQQRGRWTKAFNKRKGKTTDSDTLALIEQSLQYLASKKKTKEADGSKEAGASKKTVAKGSRGQRTAFKSAETIESSDSDEQVNKDTAPPPDTAHSFSGLAGIAARLRADAEAARRQQKPPKPRKQQLPNPTDDDSPDGGVDSEFARSLHAAMDLDAHLSTPPQSSRAPSPAVENRPDNAMDIDPEPSSADRLQRSPQSPHAEQPDPKRARRGE